MIKTVTSPNIIARIRELAHRVDSVWQRGGYEPSAFAPLAEVALRDLVADLPTNVDELLLRELVTEPEFPAQWDPASQFGEPPVTIARSERCVFDVYFWLDGTTNIHQHGFSGAFAVLAGSSVHSTFRFECAETFGDHLTFGALRPMQTELLNVGDVRQIRAGATFIHSLFHLERPSISFVYRTLKEPESGPQFSYMPPTLAYDSKSPPEIIDRARDLVLMAYAAQHRDADKLAELYVAQADTLSRFALLRHAELKLTLAQFDTLLKRALTFDQLLAKYARPAFEESRRQRNLLLRRKDIVDAEHRFFLALLVNVHCLTDIKAHIAARYPGANVEQKISEWTCALTAAPTPEVSKLGVVLDGAAMQVFELMLRGHRDEAVIEQLKSKFDSEDVERHAATIIQICAGLRDSPVFAPLFRHVA